MKNIIFDFGGVLIDWNPRYLYRKIFASEEEMEWFLASVCSGPWNAMQDAGRPFAQGIAVLKEKYPKYSAQIEDYFNRWDEMLGGEVKGTASVVRELKEKGCKLYGLTNWSAETLPRARHRFDVLGLLDGTVVSGEEKLIKPDPEIYKRLLSRFGLKAEDCLFIDDNADNVSAAKKLGFGVIRFENAVRLREDLGKKNIL